MEILKGFRYTSHYSQYTWAAYEGRVFLFLARTEEMNVQLGEQTEHDLFAWLSLQEAIDRISFPSSRSALLKAHEFLILRSSRRARSFVFDNTRARFLRNYLKAILHLI